MLKCRVMLRGPGRESRGKVSVSPKWSVPSLLGLTLPRRHCAAFALVAMRFSPPSLPATHQNFCFHPLRNSAPLHPVPLLIPPPSWLSAVMDAPALPLSYRSSSGLATRKGRKGCWDQDKCMELIGLINFPYCWTVEFIFRL